MVVATKSDVQAMLTMFEKLVGAAFLNHAHGIP